MSAEETIPEEIEEVEEIDEIEVEEPVKDNSLKWMPLIGVVCALFYMHGAALGWYMCSK